MEVLKVLGLMCGLPALNLSVDGNEEKYCDRETERLSD